MRIAPALQRPAVIQVQNNKSNHKNIMKTQIHTFIRSLLVVSVLGAVLAMPQAVRAEKPSVEQRLKMLQLMQVKTQGQAEELKADDMIAMACTKCKSVTVSTIRFDEKGKRVNGVTVGSRHGCPGCGSEIEITGIGKGREAILKHTCKACGDDSAFCCATSSGDKTKGMEKK